MDNYPNILGEFLHFGDQDDEGYELIAMAIIEDEQSQNHKRKSRHGGSVPGRVMIDRGRAEGHFRSYNDYFSKNPTYPPSLFRRRFRMNRDLFCRILNAVEDQDPYFVQRSDGIGVLGLSSLQKVTATFRMFAYGAPADSVDEYARIGESTAIESLKRFVQAVVDVFGETYLRSPNSDDVAKLLAINTERGFPGMLGSIDCMHWTWKNCPTVWHGQYSGHYPDPSIILEAVASQNLWIWHAFFGMPGSLNDINVLERSPVFGSLTNGRAPSVNYNINGHDYTMGYYLADGIYPNWATFVKSIPCPVGLKKQHFVKTQEAARKDVERAFGVLQSRFAIVRGPARAWSQETLANIMKACIIMHNMIIENEGNTGDNELESFDSTPPVTVSHEQTNTFQEFLINQNRLVDVETHSQLQEDLVEHLWQVHGN